MQGQTRVYIFMHATTDTCIIKQTYSVFCWFQSLHYVRHNKHVVYVCTISHTFSCEIKGE